MLRESFAGLYLWHARRILRGPVMVLAAERDGAPVGVAMAKMLARGVGYVYYVAVSGHERGRGVGGVLLDVCLSRLSTQGAASVLASVTPGNAASEQLVEGRGFKPWGFREAARLYGAARALFLWFTMTVAPGERVYRLDKSTAGQPRSAASRRSSRYPRRK